MSSFDPAHFLNRELSWLEFNRRVLAEACDPAVPLLERVKFFSIFSSNLDEFFEVRVAGIKQQIESDFVGQSFDGLTATESFRPSRSACMGWWTSNTVAGANNSCRNWRRTASSS